MSTTAGPPAAAAAVSAATTHPARPLRRRWIPPTLRPVQRDRAYAFAPDESVDRIGERVRRQQHLGPGDRACDDARESLVAELDGRAADRAPLRARQID